MPSKETASPVPDKPVGSLSDKLMLPLIRLESRACFMFPVQSQTVRIKGPAHHLHRFPPHCRRDVSWHVMVYYEFIMRGNS
ncbi:hypothetical protein GOODEAATRI_012055 [Goodea atripinnis]|uniref:Uncharacterized protein n=1 Tax=Goodea atripinnis TaxID=208336 RepID=A0ABV0PN17_9TELE